MSKVHPLSLLWSLFVLGASVGCSEPQSVDGGNDEPSANDVDGDGIPNGEDGDVDGDGYPNAVDLDIDGDRIPNEIDDDIDSDGTANGDDDTPFGANPDGVVGPWADADADGEPNLLDADDDNDGVPDGEDPTDTGVDPCIGLEGPPPEECNTPVGEDPPDDGDGGGGGNEGEDELPPNCTEQVFDPAEPIPPRIMLVVDRSGSMNDDAVGFPGSKWDTAVDTLDTVTHQLETSVELGLALYPAGADQDQLCSAGSLAVAVRLNNANAIVSALNDTGPGGGTPTATTLLVARGNLSALGSQGGQRAIVLATDGGPNCNDSLNGNTCTCVARRDDGSPDQQQCRDFSANCLDDVNTIAAAAQVASAGFPVFVLGLPGTENFSGVLRSTAQAGGTNDFYNANSASSLAQSLEEIAIRLGSCRFDLPGSPRPDQITVAVDGAPVARDAGRDDGWDLIDSNTIELFGPACEGASRAQQDVTVTTCF